MSHPSMSAGRRSGGSGWLAGVAWFIVMVMLALLAWVGIQRAGVSFAATEPPAQNGYHPAALLASPQAPLPEYNIAEDDGSILREPSFHTVIPDQQPIFTLYTVQEGDSITGIAKEFHIKPETVLYANFDQLGDNPNNLTIGQKLKIPSIDGVLYQWKKSDQIEKVAHTFRAKADDIITWPDNHIDIADPKVPGGSFVMIPGGSRDLIMTVVATIWRANSGANETINPACDTSRGSYVGTGSFGWPTVNHYLSGNDYWSGHLGIDISAAEGAPVYAADSGVVVYAGPIDGGYGLMVMIDHGNGFHTLYGHNSLIVVGCGQNVAKGQVISYAGSTGNSTGPHLHFEIRYRGMFVNPWDYLK